METLQSEDQASWAAEGTANAEQGEASEGALPLRAENSPPGPG